MAKSVLQQQLDEWRDNAKHMYERLDTVSLDWPTLTAQWRLDDESGHRALVATYSLGAEDEFVKEVEVDTDKLKPEEHQLRQWKVPRNGTTDEKTAGVEEEGETPTNEVQRIRQCPADPTLFVAFAADSGDIIVYRGESDAPVTRLEAHTAPGYGLAWEPMHTIQWKLEAQEETPARSSGPFRLVSGAEDGLLVLWELSVAEGSEVKVERKAEHKTGSVVNDVSWDHADRVIAALENGHVLILDPTASEPLSIVADMTCHEEGVNTAALSPFARDLLATGAADHRWRLWDVRRSANTDPEGFGEPQSALLYENQAHGGAINALRWSPHLDAILATAGMDGVVYLWDIRKIGQDQPHEDVADGAAELLFKHNGHLKGEQVQEIDFHPKVPLLLLSADGRNALMSWKPNEEVLGKTEAPDMPAYLL